MNYLSRPHVAAGFMPNAARFFEENGAVHLFTHFCRRDNVEFWKMSRRIDWHYRLDSHRHNFQHRLPRCELCERYIRQSIPDKRAELSDIDQPIKAVYVERALHDGGPKKKAD